MEMCHFDLHWENYHMRDIWLCGSNEIMQIKVNMGESFQDYT